MGVGVVHTTVGVPEQAYYVMVTVVNRNLFSLSMCERSLGIDV